MQIVHSSGWGMCTAKIGRKSSISIITKGQKISRAIYGFLNSSKKRTKKPHKFDLRSIFLDFSFVTWKNWGYHNLLLRFSDYYFRFKSDISYIFWRMGSRWKITFEIKPLWTYEFVSSWYFSWLWFNIFFQQLQLHCALYFGAI